MSAVAHAGVAMSGRKATASAGREDDSADRLLCVLLAAYLMSLAFEGPLRYGLAVAGLPDALYVRDAIPLGSLAFLFMRTLVRDGRIDLVIAVPLALLALHGAYAAMAALPLFAVAFGIKIFIFLPYGIAMWPLVRHRWRASVVFMAALFGATLAGVLLNFFAGTLPWEGLEYRTAFGTVSTTRTWWIPGGIARLPGFTRTSFNAAMILGITGVVAMVGARRVAVQVAIGAAALAAIVLTTSKGMVLAFPVAAAWLMLQSMRHTSGTIAVRTLAGVTALLPLLVVFGGVGSVVGPADFPPLVYSVWERFSMMWPDAFALLPQGPQALLGAGPGSIGTPQLFGDAPQRFNAADNMAVFMLVSLGVPGLLYYALPAIGMGRVAAAERPEIAHACAALLVIAYGYGMSISMMEESFFCIVFGLCGGVAVRAVAARSEARAA